MRKSCCPSSHTLRGIPDTPRCMPVAIVSPQSSTTNGIMLSSTHIGFGTSVEGVPVGTPTRIDLASFTRTSGTMPHTVIDNNAIASLPAQQDQL